jgi:hypothetical protein
MQPQGQPGGDEDVNIRPMSDRGMLAAVTAEVLWALFVAYETHWAYAGAHVGRLTLPWDIQVLDFFGTWAEPAIAIVVVAWLADHALSQRPR